MGTMEPDLTLIERDRSCLVVIDVQQHFLDKLPLGRRVPLVERIAWLMRAARGVIMLLIGLSGFCFVHPAACSGRPPFSRVSCACGRAFAPARFARLIARASRTQGALHLSAESGSIRPGRAKGSGPRGCLFPRIHSTTDILWSSPLEGKFYQIANRLPKPPGRPLTPATAASAPRRWPACGR